MPVVDLLRHERIKYELRVAGSSLSDIGRRLGVAPNTVTVVSQGHHTSRRIEAAIAETLKTRPSDLWPDRYPADEAEEVGR
jgi:lambda repressor-like predicted transcriptional regulator